ncbi:MAG: hypothetical protein RMM29_10295, partial [Planctomycetota bacterium]|nr:hypothetical protein [Planctomycetota bacterium]
MAKKTPADIRKKLRDAARRARIRRQADAADELLQLYAVTAKRGIDYRTARRINALRRRLGLPDDYLPDTLYLLQRSGGRITPDGKIIKGSYVIEPPGGTRAGRVANAAAAAITIAGMLAASMLIPGSGGAGIATTTTTTATEERKRTIQAL